MPRPNFERMAVFKKIEGSIIIGATCEYHLDYQSMLPGH